VNFKVIEVDSQVGIPAYTVMEFEQKINSVALVIPVINESYRVINQLKRIELVSPNVDIIIADGGSSDESQAFFLSGEHKISTLLIKKSYGQLSTQLRMAFHYCIDKGYSAVITMDGNDKDGPLGILAIEKALKDGADFVQGSRFIPGGLARNTPLARLVAIRFLHAPLTSLIARKWYTDTTNGFRGHSIEMLQSEKVSIFREIFQGYELLAYLPIRVAKTGFRVCEVPVSRVYPDGERVPTKIEGIRSQVKILTILIRVIEGRFNP